MVEFKYTFRFLWTTDPMFTIIFAALLSCATTGKQQPTGHQLEEEHFDWICHDYEDVTEVVIETVSCDDDVLYIVSEVHLTDGQFWKRKLDRGEGCIYETFFPLFDDYCIEIAGVTLTAYAY